MSQLTNYIQKELDKGFSKELITKKLLQAGYTKQEINESFVSLKAVEPLLRRKILDTIHQDLHIKWSKVIFPLLAIGLLVFFGYLLFLYIQGKPVAEEMTICDELSDVHEKDICYLELAAGGKELCEEIGSDILRTFCKQKIWEEDDCVFEMIMGKDTEECLLKKAIRTKDTSYCYQQKDDIGCLVKLVEETSDINLCEGEVFCYQRYAIITKNKSICDEIPNKLLINDCYEYFDKKVKEIQ